jgi:hypothetical protein
MDGSALPAWLGFDNLEQRFTGMPPNGFSGELIIKVIARDGIGRQVETIFRLEIVEFADSAALTGVQDLMAQIEAEAMQRDVLLLGGMQVPGNDDLGLSDATSAVKP